MEKWIEKPRDVLVQKQSLEIASFCPYCDAELDGLSLANSHADCDCGMWSESYSNPPILYYAPNPAPKDIK